MTIDEPMGVRMRQAFAKLTSDDELADAIMESMPPVPWTDLATKTDLAQLGTGLTNKIDALDTRLTGRIDRLDYKIDALDTRLTGRIDSLETRFDALDNKIDSLDTRLTGRIDTLDTRLGAEIIGLEGRLSLQMALHTRTVVIAMIALTISTLGAMFAFVSVT